MTPRATLNNCGRKQATRNERRMLRPLRSSKPPLGLSSPPHGAPTWAGCSPTPNWRPQKMRPETGNNKCETVALTAPVKRASSRT